MEKCRGFHFLKLNGEPKLHSSWKMLIYVVLHGLSLNNRRYFILFVNDCTKMMWIYVLNEKLEAFSNFLQFKALVEKQSGCKMKTMKTDRSGDFIYSSFMNYCKDN